MNNINKNSSTEIKKLKRGLSFLYGSKIEDDNFSDLEVDKNSQDSDSRTNNTKSKKSSLAYSDIDEDDREDIKKYSNDVKTKNKSKESENYKVQNYNNNEFENLDQDVEEENVEEDFDQYELLEDDYQEDQDDGDLSDDTENEQNNEIVEELADNVVDENANDDYAQEDNVSESAKEYDVKNQKDYESYENKDDNNLVDEDFQTDFVTESDKKQQENEILDEEFDLDDKHVNFEDAKTELEQEDSEAFIENDDETQLQNAPDLNEDGLNSKLHNDKQIQNDFSSQAINLQNKIKQIKNDIATHHNSSNHNSENDSTLDFVVIPIDFIETNPNQPRKTFNTEELENLARSIATFGILQPIIVTKFNGGGQKKYVIVAGERRYRASIIAGLKVIPCLIQTSKANKSFETSIVENTQRQNLSPIEEAEAYKYLMDKYDYTQEDVSLAVQKSRAHIANLTRVLNLPHSVKSYVSNGQLSLGHAKILVGLTQADMLAKISVEKQLSIKELERLILKSSKKNNLSELKNKIIQEDPIDNFENLKNIIQNLKQSGIVAKFTDGRKSGTYKASLSFSSKEALQNFLDLYN